MKKKLALIAVIVAVGGIVAWGNEDYRTLESAKFSQLLNTPLAQTTDAPGEFSSVRARNPDGSTVITASWWTETTSFSNRGDGAIGVTDFNGNLRLLMGATPRVSGTGTVGSVCVTNSGGEVVALMDGEVGFFTTIGDIAENFSSSETYVEPGSVMSLDAENPGHMKRSGRAYDRLVAGVESGAENYRPGMTLRGNLESGVPVTLTGTVYCKVTNANGKIEAGDLLTTSDVPGHAMKATDATKTQEAILGKAMEDFDGESGLIMILAALQ